MDSNKLSKKLKVAMHIDLRKKGRESERRQWPSMAKGLCKQAMKLNWRTWELGSPTELEFRVQEQKLELANTKPLGLEQQLRMMLQVDAVSKLPWMKCCWIK